MNENSITTRLLDCIKKLSDAATEMLLTLALGMVDVESLPITTCPYCGGKHIVRNGKKCGPHSHAKIDFYHGDEGKIIALDAHHVYSERA